MNKNELSVLSKYDISIEEYNQVINTYIKNNKMEIKPGKRKKQIAIFVYVSTLFEDSIIYDEKQINKVLKDFYSSDYVTLRRELIDYSLLIRTNDGQSYRKA